MAAPRPEPDPTPGPSPRPRRRAAAQPARSSAGGDRPLRVLIGGASGLIGTALQERLRAAGHTPLRLVRRAPRGGDEFTWSPEAKILDHRVLEGVDAVVNLSGASISRVPWTTGYRRQILRSRITATETLVEAMSRVATPPPVFLSGSATGFYGDRPGTPLTEESPRGDGFLAGVVEAWERTAMLAPSGVRTVLLRTSPVYVRGGAPLEPLRLATSLGLGARIGQGVQHWAWISLVDEAAAIVHLLTSALEGPVNLAGPAPTTADDLTRRLARDLHRPRAFVIPERVIDLLAGDFGREMLLASQRVVPARLLADGFAFTHPTIGDAIGAALQR
jgi:uncharacterized protein (TIGR01777 family)